MRSKDSAPQPEIVIGQPLEQLLQQRLDASALQFRCAVKDQRLLVLAEHLLHVEPQIEQTFVKLEAAVRDLVPAMLSAEVTLLELPVQLFLRIAGYQQPYASHQFQLELPRPISSPEFAEAEVEPEVEPELEIEVESEVESGALADQTDQIVSESAEPDLTITDPWFTSSADLPELPEPDVDYLPESAEAGLLAEVDEGLDIDVAQNIEPPPDLEAEEFTIDQQDSLEDQQDGSDLAELADISAPLEASLARESADDSIESQIEEDPEVQPSFLYERAEPEQPDSLPNSPEVDLLIHQLTEIEPDVAEPDLLIRELSDFRVPEVEPTAELIPPFELDWLEPDSSEILDSTEFEDSAEFDSLEFNSLEFDSLEFDSLEFDSADQDSLNELTVEHSEIEHSIENYHPNISLSQSEFESSAELEAKSEVEPELELESIYDLDAEAEDFEPDSLELDSETERLDTAELLENGSPEFGSLEAMMQEAETLEAEELASDIPSPFDETFNETFDETTAAPTEMVPQRLLAEPAESGIPAAHISAESSPIEAESIAPPPAEPTELEPAVARHLSSLGVLIGALGMFGLVGGLYMLTRPCVIGRCQQIQQAQQLSLAAIQTARTTDSALDVVGAYKQLSEANYLLSTIPVWSSQYANAQRLLASYEDQSVALKQVVEAIEQGNQIAQRSQNPPHPLPVWREIQWGWREVIEKLEKIPSDNPLYALVQRKLQEYRANLSDINQRVTREQQAQERVAAARKIGERAQSQAEAAQSVENWQETAANWTTAIQQLQQIPQGTVAHAEAQQLLALYQPKFTQANIQQVQEQTAADAYAQALSAAERARSLEQQNQWTEAAAEWRNALNAAQQIPSRSAYYSQVQPLLGTYAKTLQQAQDNSQRSGAIQLAQASFDQVCAGSPKLCTYTLSPQAIRVQFTPLYDQTVSQMIANASPSPGFPPATVDQINGMLRSLADMSEATQVPVELYNSNGSKLGTYSPNASGYRLQQ